MRTCTIDGCEKPLLSRGWCPAHYARWRKHGDPTTLTSTRHLSESGRFWARVQKGPGCWHWTGGMDNGYGKFSGVKAHRYSYEELVGPIAEGMVLDHRCHNRACVKPEHLRPVTQKQNMENRSGATRINSTGVRGVNYHRVGTGAYVARVGHEGKQIHVGRFKTLAEAEAAVIAKRNELFTCNDADRISA